jgi:hypothetical protein
VNLKKKKKKYSKVVTGKSTVEEYSKVVTGK